MQLPMQVSRSRSRGRSRSSSRSSRTRNGAKASSGRMYTNRKSELNGEMDVVNSKNNRLWSFLSEAFPVFVHVIRKRTFCRQGPLINSCNTHSQTECRFLHLRVTVVARDSLSGFPTPAIRIVFCHWRGENQGANCGHPACRGEAVAHAVFCDTVIEADR